MTASESRPIIVIGAGIVGAMTAFYLAKRGLEVLVIDAASRPAEVTSHANAGIIAVGHAKSWAGPGAPLQILQALTGRSASVVVTGRPDTALMRWGLSFMMNCTTRAAVRNTGKLQALSRRSRELLPGVAEEVGLGDQMQLETGLYIFQDHRQFDEYLHSLSSDDRKTLAPLDREELISLDPALAGIGHGLVGGLKSTLDAAGDCRLFTCRALDHAGSRLGVRTLFGQKITGFGVDGQTVHAVRVQNREIPCTAVVVAAGVESTDLLRPLGVSPNIYPVKGYSGTWQITDPAAAPRLPYIDETNLLAVATYGGKNAHCRTLYLALPSRRQTSGIHHTSARLVGADRNHTSPDLRTTWEDHLSSLWQHWDQRFRRGRNSRARYRRCDSGKARLRASQRSFAARRRRPAGLRRRAYDRPQRA